MGIKGFVKAAEVTDGEKQKQLKDVQKLISFLSQEIETNALDYDNIWKIKQNLICVMFQRCGWSTRDLEEALADC